VLGCRLIANLLDRGYSVRGLVRTAKRYDGPVDNKLKLVCKDLSNELDKIVHDVQAVNHTPAVTTQNHLSFSSYLNVNGEATIKLFRVEGL
jgi:nucleoside-diphosphate-sugar epimerase